MPKIKQLKSGTLILRIMPVLKSHEGCGITGASKNMFGVLSMQDGQSTARHYNETGNHCADMWCNVKTPDLTILDCIWSSFMHNKGFVYRDLKPENVLVDIDGHVKLADFGLSKFIQDPTNSFCGSPEYMSPEMLLGEGHSFPVDFYSLGAILFEMLTGLPPHYSTNQSKMFQDIFK